jgi:hypothetical protein
MNMNVFKYEERYEELWDNFVNKKSANGTFLQSRLFLNYHPQSRFQDCSIFVCKNGINDIYAVIPACEYVEDTQKVFHAHKGSTFGGIVINSIRYNSRDVQEIIDCLDKWLQDEGYNKVILKVTSDVFAQRETDLLRYMLWNKGYEHYEELSTVIDFSNYAPDILSNFNKGRRYDTIQCKKHSLIGKIIESNDDICIFHEILCENLMKFHVKPVHSIDEIFELKNRMKGGIKFFGVFEDKRLVAGAMLFEFENVNVYHTQYLCARQNISDYSPMTYLMYSLIEFAKDRQVKHLSFGTSTTQNGHILNMDLIRAKESYGSRYSTNSTFYKLY